MRSSHAFAFAILLLLGAIGFWLVSGLGTEPQRAATGSHSSSASPEPLSTSDISKASANERQAAAVPRSVDSAASPTPPPAPTGRLRVFVRNERGDALEGCAVSAAGQEASTDRTGSATFEVEAARTFVVVAPPKGHTLRERSGWQTVRAGTQTDVTIVLPAAANMVLWAQLVAAEDGRALAGVEVRQHPADDLVRSDADGFVQVALLDDLAWLDAHTAGRCPCRIVPEAGHEIRATALRVPLALACTLQVQVDDTAGAPVANVALRLEAMPWHLQCPRDAAPRGKPFQWTATTDVQGRAGFTDLPIGVGIRVQAEARATFAALDEQRWSFATAREQRRVVLTAAGAVHGRVTDGNGAPAAGVPVQCNRPAGAVLPRVLETVPATRKTKTASDGTFALGGLGPGTWWVGIAHDGVHRPTCIAVEVPAGGSVPIDLQALAGLAVGGRALAPDGAPRRGIPIQLMVDDQFVAGMPTDHEGRFRFANLPDGACELSVDPFETDLGLVEPMTVHAGDEHVELRLQAVNGSISGRSGGDVWVTAFRRGSSDVLGSRCELDGTFFYRGLRIGTWDLAAMDRHGRAACLGGLQVLPGRETAGVVLELVAAATLRPRHGSADEFVVCSGEHIAGIDNLHDGLPGEVRVPPGAWMVVFRMRGRDVARRQVTVQAGEVRLVDGGS